MGTATEAGSVAAVCISPFISTIDCGALTAGRDTVGKYVI